MATNKSAKRPATTLRCGNIKATIWQNVSEKGPCFAATFCRPFKDQSGAWRNGTSFGLNNLEALINVACEAKEWDQEVRHNTLNCLIDGGDYSLGVQSVAFPEEHLCPGTIVMDTDVHRSLVHNADLLRHKVEKRRDGRLLVHDSPPSV